MRCFRSAVELADCEFYHFSVTFLADTTTVALLSERKDVGPAEQAAGPLLNRVNAVLCHEVVN